MRFIRKLGWAILIVLAVGIGLCLWAFVVEPSRLTVHNVELQVPNWKPEHKNIKIAVMSDLHVGSPFITLDKVKTIVDTTNAEHPDLIVILGDFVITEVVGGKFVEPEAFAAVLKDLKAPLGTVCVLGNHDAWYDTGRVANALEQAGITVLQNEARRIDVNGRPFWIAGIGDAWTGHPDIQGTLKQVPDADPVILITHNPDLFPDVPSRVSITFAGHTHGGQVNIPFYGRRIVPSKYGERYAAGHIIEDGRHLFVTTGIGTSSLPVRFRVPPEIVILTLSPM